MLLLLLLLPLLMTKGRVRVLETVRAEDVDGHRQVVPLAGDVGEGADHAGPRLPWPRAYVAVVEAEAKAAWLEAKAQALVAARIEHQAVSPERQDGRVLPAWRRGRCR